jgi:predicted GNAT family N-acyltransferase
MNASSRRTLWKPAPGPTYVIDVGAADDDESMHGVLEVRRRVFSIEQGVPDLRVHDPDDARSLNAIAWHYLAPDVDDHRIPVSTGRLTPSPFRGGTGLIAWVATLPEYRGQGIGHRVMQFLLKASDASGASQVTLAAQVPAEHFYRRLGFITDGPRYDVRGIPHVRMVRYRNR